MEINQNLYNGAKIVKTDSGAKNGQNSCPQCGATDISINEKTGKLKCNFCGHEFEPEKIQGMESDITKLNGEIMGSGTQDIVESKNDVITLKCGGCGAEVVINTAQTTQTRCHWCRSTLSINQQVPNGAVPGSILPFKVTKEEAKEQIKNFVKKRKFYANPVFKKEFTPDNIMGLISGHFLKFKFLLIYT